MFYPEKASQSNGDVDKFGASDVLDLNWVQLMNAIHALNVEGVLVSVLLTLQEKNYHQER